MEIIRNVRDLEKIQKGENPHLNMPGQIMGLYVIYDIIQEEAGPVFQSKNEASALRETVKMMLNNRHADPLDYILYKIAEFDIQLLTLEPCKTEIKFIHLYEQKLAEEEMLRLKIKSIKEI